MSISIYYTDGYFSNYMYSGADEIMVLNIYNNAPGGTKSSSGLGSITEVLLVGVDGAHLQQHTPFELRALTEYQVTTVLPALGMYDYP